jgi:hypothetical protein
MINEREIPFYQEYRAVDHTLLMIFGLTIKFATNKTLQLMKTNMASWLLFIAGMIAFASAGFRNSDQQTFEKITVKEFELVDQNGKQRVSIKVESEGEILFRMKDQAGTIRVKLGAGEDGSALVLLDDSTEPAIHALAKKNGGSLTLRDKSGKKRVY